MVEAAESAPETPGRKIVFVLGAGASAPFLTVGGEPLSTALIARALRSDELWRKVWRHFERERGVAGHSSPGAGDHLDINEALLLRDRVLSVLQATRFDHINFEHFIQLIDKTALYLCANHRTEIAQLDSLLLGLEDNLRKQFTKSDPDGWRYLPWLVREVVLEVVLAAWEELDQPRRDSILDLHRKFFAAVARQYRGVSLYSLNYDPLVPVALRPLGYDTGFLSSGHLRPGSCPTDARRLAQLHGSVGFVPGGACAVRWFDDFREARAQRIKKVVGERLVCTGNTLQPPFSAYYQRFFRDCYEAATLVFIGVGCGGEQLNTLLAVFPVLRPEQRVVVVCLQSGPETRNFTTFGDSFLFKIASATNDAFRQGVRTDIEKLATSVDERGFGQFTKQTWLYARGSEEFYRSGTGSGLL